MRVTRAGERSPLDGRGVPGTSVPQKDLAGVGTADDERGVEWRELGTEDIGGCGEDVFRTSAEMEIVDLD